MKKNVLLCTCLFLSALAVVACTDKQQPGIKNAVPAEVTMTKAKLFDKIKGGWAGQIHPQRSDPYKHHHTNPVHFHNTI